MGFSNFFKPPRHRQFEFKPRYYDAKKEDREKRYAQARAEAEAEKRGEKYIAQRNLQRGFMRSQSKRRERNSNRRMLIILILLGVLGYYLFFM